jgi:uncharacterized membrane protein
MQRLLANAFGGWFQLRRRFPPDLLDALARAVSDGEKHHLGEVRFAVESRLPVAAVWSGMTPRQRAEQVFAQLGVWDTEHNSGVLIYLLLAERRIEIVADRGVSARTSRSAWDAVCRAMHECYQRGEWRQGSVNGIQAVHAVLLASFPSEGRENPGELSDRPVVL